MAYKLHKEVDQGEVIGLSLGVPEVDAYEDRSSVIALMPSPWPRCLSLIRATD